MSPASPAFPDRYSWFSVSSHYSYGFTSYTQFCAHFIPDDCWETHSVGVVSGGWWWKLRIKRSQRNPDAARALTLWTGKANPTVLPPHPTLGPRTLDCAHGAPHTSSKAMIWEGRPHAPPASSDAVTAMGADPMLLWLPFPCHLGISLLIPPINM